MSTIRLEDVGLLESVKGPNNPHVNIFTLDKVLNDTVPDKEQYSYLCKTLILFVIKYLIKISIFLIY